MFNTVCNIEEAFSSSMNATRRIDVSCDKQRCSIYREIVLIYEPTIGIHTAAYLCLVRKISRVIVSSVPEGDNWIIFRRKGDKLVRGWKLGQRGEIEYVTEINSRLILDETQRWNIVVVKWKKDMINCTFSIMNHSMFYIIQPIFQYTRKYYCLESC